MTEDVIEQQRIILFDGVCNFCNSSVIFILQREKRPTFKFEMFEFAFLSQKANTFNL